jgi:hypothetical protein
MDWLIFVLNVQQAVFQDKNKYNNCQYIKTVYYRNEGVAQQRLTATGKVWRVWYCIVWDSSAVRLAGAMGHQSTLHKENSGFVAPTLGWHISTFRGYQFIFYPKPLYKSLHQSFFCSFTTILPSESGVTLDYSTTLPETLSFRQYSYPRTNN